jgi:catechol 2,3-dioxygenase-like lactoylglutathione lyase family enzyme
MKLAHVGLAVQDIDAAIALWSELGFTVAQRFEKPEPKALVAQMQDMQGGTIELWQFQQDHPLNGYIGRHTAFMSDNVRADAARLTAAGFTEVIAYTEGVILNYIFVQDQFGMSYEIAEEKK